MAVRCHRAYAETGLKYLVFIKCLKDECSGRAFPITIRALDLGKVEGNLGPRNLECHQTTKRLPRLHMITWQATVGTAYQ